MARKIFPVSIEERFLKRIDKAVSANILTFKTRSHFVEMACSDLLDRMERKR